MDHSFLRDKPYQTIRLNEVRTQDEYARELSDLSRRIREVEELFNLTSDPDQIEAYIYEINSLGARYNGILKQVRGISANAQ